MSVLTSVRAANKGAAAATGDPMAYLMAAVRYLHNFKLGGGSADRIRRPDLIFILSNLVTLLRNGVSLARALGTLAAERSLRKYAPLLSDLRARLEAGESFSSALAHYHRTFDELMIHQIRVGERSGSVCETLQRVLDQLEGASQLKGKILKKLSYPIVVVVAGISVVTFMMLFIVPVFEETYAKAHLPLPLPTKILIAGGKLMWLYGWIAPATGLIALIAYKRLRKNEQWALKIDRWKLRLPLVGDWIREAAVLQFATVLSTMLDSGFKLVDALSVTGGAVGNRAVRHGIERLKSAVLRGERLSHEVDELGDLFPPLVSQLVIVGEQTGRMSQATEAISTHLKGEIERRADRVVGALEPVLTIGMAAGIGLILLAIYMPLFGMADAVEGM